MFADKKFFLFTVISKLFLSLHTKDPFLVLLLERQLISEHLKYITNEEYTSDTDVLLYINILVRKCRSFRDMCKFWIKFQIEYRLGVCHVK